MPLDLNKEISTFNSLEGNFKHYCPDYDYMAIDENCPEFENCLCYTEEEKRKYDGKR